MTKKKTILFYSLITLGVGLIVSAQIAPSSPVPTEPPVAQEETIDPVVISQMLGHLIGSNLEVPGFAFNSDEIIEGIKMAVNGEDPPMSEEAYASALQALSQRGLERIAAQNLKEAESFLQQNAKHPQVITLEENRLQYRLLCEGKGNEVAVGSVPVIHYTGTFADGTEFGTSRGLEPVALSLQDTVAGFSRGIVGMKEGEKRMLYIHPDLGYGKDSAFPPNSLLVFEVEVLQANSQE